MAYVFVFLTLSLLIAIGIDLSKKSSAKEKPYEAPETNTRPQKLLGMNPEDRKSFLAAQESFRVQYASFLALPPWSIDTANCSTEEKAFAQRSNEIVKSYRETLRNEYDVLIDEGRLPYSKEVIRSTLKVYAIWTVVAYDLSNDAITARLGAIACGESLLANFQSPDESDVTRYGNRSYFMERLVNDVAGPGSKPSLSATYVDALEIFNKYMKISGDEGRCYRQELSNGLQTFTDEENIIRWIMSEGKENVGNWKEFTHFHSYLRYSLPEDFAEIAGTLR